MREEARDQIMAKADRLMRKRDLSGVIKALTEIDGKNKNESDGDSDEEEEDEEGGGRGGGGG